MQRAGTAMVVLAFGALLACRAAPVQGMVKGADPVVVELGELRATRSEVDRRFRIAAALLARRSGTTLDAQEPAVLARLREQFLDQYATGLVLLQEARRRQLEVSDAEVERALGELFASREDEAEFLARVAPFDGASALLREIVQDEETVELLTEVMLREIRIPPGDVITLHHDVKDQLATAEEVCVRHIQTDSVAAAERIRAALEAGESFAALAAAHSTDAATADKGGDLGCFERGPAGYRSAFERAAFLAEEGAVVGPVASRLGQHVLIVYEHKPPRVPTLNEAYAMIERDLALEQLPERLQALISASGITMFPENFLATDE